MANIATRVDFVHLVADEICFGIERALDYWLGRIELEAVDGRLTTAERISAIQQILREYKVATGKGQSVRASA